MARLDAEAGFERIDEGLEEIEEERVGLPHDRAHLLVDERREDDRLGAARVLRLDAREAFLGLFRAVDEGQGDLIELDAFELGQQAMAEHLRRYARPSETKNTVRRCVIS